MFHTNKTGQFKQKMFIAPVLVLISNFMLVERDKEMCEPDL
jgi:hypothetical protein